MGEEESSQNFPHLRDLRRLREELGKKERSFPEELEDPELLAAMAASQDGFLRDEAQRLIRQGWLVSPERDARTAEEVDLMELLAGFDEEQRKAIAKNLCSLQLTEGCNGGCYFCFLAQKGRREIGVTARFSFDSLKRFFESYGAFLPSNLCLYWESDPFDWRDNEGRSFVDVYQLYREKVSREGYLYISTALPSGSFADFIKFMQYAIEEQKEKIFRGEDSFLIVRISLNEINLPKVEAVFRKLTQILLAKGYTESQINTFYQQCVRIERRFKEDISLLGPLIEKRDVFRETEFSSCVDGIYISPKRIEGIATTIPTVYCPSGNFRVSLSPQNLHRDGIQLNNLNFYSGFHWKDCLGYKIAQRKVMIPPIRRIDGYGYIYEEDPCEDLVLKLGRIAASLGKLREDIGTVGLASLVRRAGSSWIAGSSYSQREEYLQVCAQEFRRRQYAFNEVLQFAHDFIRKKELSPADLERLNFYILVTKVFLAEIDFLVDQIEEGVPLTLIGGLVLVLEHIGREQVDYLGEIILGLRDCVLEIRQGSISGESIRDKVFNILRVPFNLNSLDCFPSWVETLVDSLYFFQKQMISKRDGKE